MPLTVGDKLGPYEILAPLGAGGMGEVYRARDTKLKRDVALKVLPEAFANDGERMARFQREAEVLASLNHPNIAAIYGVEQRALVMELVEGDSPKGPLPFDEAWKIASQIADALEYAHEKGVVHRDLKPANIKVTPDGVVKLLDFGLAKAFSPQRETSASPENSPTLTLGATEMGVILGTAAYMAPEQARGKAVDKRADIWSFGVVLYELLTGERLFHGEDAAETLAAVIHKQPDLAKVPTQARRLLEDCLQKDPKQRLRDIGDAKRLVADAAALAVPGLPRFKWAPWIAAAAMAAIAAVAFWAPWRSAPKTDQPLIRLNVDLGPDAITADYNTFAISPDGERLVFVIRGTDGRTRLATRLLSEDKPTILEGTENPQNPFFSPDGIWIAYAADGKLRKVLTRGGTPVVLCDVVTFEGGTWAEDGTLAVSLSAVSALSRVAAAGGSPEPMGELSGSEVTHRWPQALPGGRYVLATASGNLTNFESAAILAISLRTGETKRLVEGGYSAHYVEELGKSKGYLTYLREGSLFAVGFDPIRLEIQGEAVPFRDEVDGNLLTGAGRYDVSRNGVLFYRRGRQNTGGWPVVWMDHTGQTKPLVSATQSYRTMGFSPDGNRLALSVDAGGGTDMFVYDLTRDTTSRLTSAGKGRFLVIYPTWTPDGRHIISSYPGQAGFGLAWYRADGGGEPQMLLESKVGVWPTSVSPDGKRIAYARNDPVSAQDIWVLPLNTSDSEHPKAGNPEVFVQTPAKDSMPAFSRDGHWIVYSSSETGRNEAYVRPYPGEGGKWQISKDGGSFPLWAPDGRSLYFLSPDSHIMVVDYEAKGAEFSPGKARQWSPVPIWNPTNVIPYALHPDGKRFAVFPVPEPSPEEKGNAHLTFLLNFADELRRKVPLGK